MLKANSYYIPNGNKVHFPAENDLKRERAASFEHYCSGPDTLSENGDDLGYLCRRILSGEDILTEGFGYRQLFGKSLVKPTVTNVTPHVVSKCFAHFVRQMIIKCSKDIVSSPPPSSKILKIFERERKPKIQKRIAQIGESVSTRFSGRHSVILPEEPAIDVPSLETITQFIYDICFSTQMEYECSVVSLIYLTRFLEKTYHCLQFNEYNWRSIVLSCMLIANKMWDDFHVPNISYCAIFPGLSLERVNQLEIGILIALDYDTWVSPSTYADKHFSIQACIAEEEIKLLKQQHSMQSKLHSTPLSPIPQSPCTDVKQTVASDGNPSIMLRTNSNGTVTANKNSAQVDSSKSQDSQTISTSLILTNEINLPQRDVSQSVNEEQSRNIRLDACQFIDRERKVLLTSKTSSNDQQNSFICCVPFLFPILFTKDAI